MSDRKYAYRGVQPFSSVDPIRLASPLGHGLCSFFFLEHLKRTRRYITRRDRGSPDTGGARYGHR